MTQICQVYNPRDVPKKLHVADLAQAVVRAQFVDSKGVLGVPQGLGFRDPSIDQM